MLYYTVEAIIEGVKDTAKTAISGIPLTQPKPSPLFPKLPPLHLGRSPLLQGKHSYNPQQRVIFPKKNVAVPEFRTATQAYSVENVKFFKLQTKILQRFVVTTSVVNS